MTAFTGYGIDTTVIVDVFNSPPVQGDCNSLQNNILSSNITRAACLLWTDFLKENFIHQKQPANLKTVKTLAQQFEIVSQLEKAKRNKSLVFWNCFMEITVIFVLSYHCRHTSKHIINPILQNVANLSTLVKPRQQPFVQLYNSDLEMHQSLYVFVILNHWIFGTVTCKSFYSICHFFCVSESSKYYPRLTFDDSTHVEKYIFLVERPVCQKSSFCTNTIKDLGYAEVQTWITATPTKRN